MRRRVTRDYSSLLLRSGAFWLRMMIGSAVGIGIAALYGASATAILGRLMMVLPGLVAGPLLGAITGAMIVILFRLVTSPVAYDLYRKALVQNHLCTTCGYSLIGNSSGICPECGTSIESGAEAIRSTNGSN